MQDGSFDGNGCPLHYYEYWLVGSIRDNISLVFSSPLLGILLCAVVSTIVLGQSSGYHRQQKFSSTPSLLQHHDGCETHDTSKTTAGGSSDRSVVASSSTRSS